MTQIPNSPLGPNAANKPPALVQTLVVPLSGQMQRPCVTQAINRGGKTKPWSCHPYPGLLSLWGKNRFFDPGTIPWEQLALRN